MAFIPGYDAVIELGATPDDVSAVGQAYNIQKRYNDLRRPVAGQAYVGRGAGQYEVTFTFSGLVDSSEYGTIEGHADGTAIAVSLEVGDSGGTSAGTWAGNFIITELTADGQVEDDWKFTATFQSAGAITFT